MGRGAPKLATLFRRAVFLIFSSVRDGHHCVFLNGFIKFINFRTLHLKSQYIFGTEC